MNQGLIIFRPNSTISSNNFNSAQWLQNLLTDEEWDVGQGRYQVLENLHFFENAEVLYLKQLKLRWIMNQLILSSISPISFPCLKELFLNGNNLTSIEQITQANLPNLQNLNLKENNIVSIGSLRRCSIPNLKQLSVYKNRINDVQKLTQLNSPKLGKIWYNAKLENGNIIGSITWIAKLESKRINSFIIAHNQRINEEEATQKLGKKFENKINYEYQMMDDRFLNWL